MGPTCSVLIGADERDVLSVVDSTLEAFSDEIQRTRKGRVWDVWIDDRPFHVEALNGEIALSAGCNDVADRSILRRLADRIATATNGVASEATK